MLKTCKCFSTRTSKRKQKGISLTGFGVEVVRRGDTQEISSLAATCVQSSLPGHGGTGNKLVAGFLFWPSKQSLATLFYTARVSVNTSCLASQNAACDSTLKTGYILYFFSHLTTLRCRTVTCQVIGSIRSFGLGQNLTM